MLSKLEKAIKDLETKKNTLLIKIQDKGWKDDRPNEKIPEITESRFNFYPIDDLKVIPAKAPLPKDIGRLYQQWYSAARIIVAKNYSDRLDEFDELYLSEAAYAPGIKKLLEKKFITKEEQFRLMDIITDQFNILGAIPNHLKYSIYDIELTAYSILMDDELDAANHLLSNGFLRAAGVLAGVSLERHLRNLLRKRTPPIKYKDNSTLSSLNDLCKETAYDLIAWRKNQHLIDLRNLCAHDKIRGPSKDEVTELIKGVTSIIKSYN